jgi:hypothetical protein
VVTFGVQPPVTVAVPPEGVRRRVPYLRAPALTQRPVLTSQNGWLLVAPMTAVRVPARIVRSYRSVSWVDHDGGDGLGLGLAGLGAGGQDLLAGFEGGDRDGSAAGEQDQGAGGEALPAAHDFAACWAALPAPSCGNTRCRTVLGPIQGRRWHLT